MYMCPWVNVARFPGYSLIITVINGRAMGLETMVEANLVFYLVGATLLILLVIAIALTSYYRGSRLNWYDQNILETIDLSSPPQYVRCKAMYRFDTEDDPDIPQPEQISRVHLRRQSRIVIRFDDDLTELFTVPKPRKMTTSMFHNPHSSQIDRDLYESAMGDAIESACSEENQNPMDCCGSLKLAVSYDWNLGLLHVTLLQATDLIARRQDGYPNPYFRLSLDIAQDDNINETTKTNVNVPKIQQQSKIYKASTSPVLNDEFIFQVNNAAVCQSRMEVLVFDFDQFSVDECIGYCWLTLGRLQLSTQSTQSIQQEQQRSIVFWAETGFGEILLSLTYLAKAQRLTVNVFKARNLKIDLVEQQQPAPAVRVTLSTNGERRVKRKKTSSKKNTPNPQYNESLSFSVASLCDSILDIEVVHEYGTFGMASRVLGRLELPLHLCKDLWRAIIREEKSQARWYPLEEP